MWNVIIFVILTSYISLVINSSISGLVAIAQLNEPSESTSKKDTWQLSNSNDYVTTVDSSNRSGIMENTSGLIDDAITVFKNSFKSLFGK